MIIQLLTAMLGTLGFCLIFNVRERFLFPAAISGLLTWAVYLLAARFLEPVFQITLIAASFGAFLAEVMARVLKAPSTVFFIPAMIPLSPGRNLYNTLQSAVVNDEPAFALNGMMTLQYTLGIAAGMCIAWAFCYMYRKLKQQYLLKHRG
ncbi:MAG: threonine/serine exporter family protein [Clostridia bacterium]|nr:threonine/serine exporter family protein [Clostridia bacterium]